MIIWVLLVLQGAGLYWGTRCTLERQPPGEPPVVVDFMFVPNESYLQVVHDAALPDSVVDALLDRAIRGDAANAGYLCRPVERRYDPDRVRLSESWPRQKYDPRVGWLRWDVRSPATPMHRSIEPSKRDPGAILGVGYRTDA